MASDRVTESFCTTEDCQSGSNHGDCPHHYDNGYDGYLIEANSQLPIFCKRVQGRYFPCDLCSLRQLGSLEKLSCAQQMQLFPSQVACISLDLPCFSFFTTRQMQACNREPFVHIACKVTTKNTTCQINSCLVCFGWRDFKLLRLQSKHTKAIELFQAKPDQPKPAKLYLYEPFCNNIPLMRSRSKIET